MGELTVYTIAVGFFLGGGRIIYKKSVTQELVAPFAVLLGGVSKSVEGVTISLGPVKLEIGKVIGSALTLMVALFVVAFTIPYIKAYAPMIGARR